MLTKKKRNSQPKSRECFIPWETFRTSSPGGSISTTPEKLLRGRKEEGKESGSVKVCSKGGRESEHQRLLSIKETRYLKLRNLHSSASRKMQASELTEIFAFICISALWGQHPEFLHPLSLGSWCSLLAGTLLLREFPEGSLAHMWMARTEDSCDILIYWYGRKYSISQNDLHFRGWCAENHRSSRKALEEVSAAIRWWTVMAMSKEVTLKWVISNHILCKFGKYGMSWTSLVVAQW